MDSSGGTQSEGVIDVLCVELASCFLGLASERYFHPRGNDGLCSPFARGGLSYGARYGHRRRFARRRLVADRESGEFSGACAHLSSHVLYGYVSTLDLHGRERHLEGYTQDGERLGGSEISTVAPVVVEQLLFQQT